MKIWVALAILAILAATQIATAVVLIDSPRISRRARSTNVTTYE